MTTDSELEQQFTEHDISHRLLYPMWYRMNRGIGLRHKPPVLLNLIEHYVCLIPSMLFALGLAALIYQWLNGRPSNAVTPILITFLLVPLLNWIRYRNIRRRIGLTGNSSTGE